MVFSLNFNIILGRYQVFTFEKEIRKANEAKQAIAKLV